MRVNVANLSMLQLLDSEPLLQFQLCFIGDVSGWGSFGILLFLVVGARTFSGMKMVFSPKF